MATARRPGFQTILEDGVTIQNFQHLSIIEKNDQEIFIAKIGRKPFSKNKDKQY